MLSGLKRCCVVKNRPIAGRAALSSHNPISLPLSGRCVDCRVIAVALGPNYIVDTTNFACFQGHLAMSGAPDRNADHIPGELTAGMIHAALEVPWVQDVRCEFGLDDDEGQARMRRMLAELWQTLLAAKDRESQP